MSRATSFGFGNRQPIDVSYVAPGFAHASVGLGLHPRRAGHRLDAAGDDEVGVAGADRLRGHGDRRHARRAEPVHGDAGHLVGQPGEQHRHARDVAVVLARLVGAAEDDLVDRAELTGLVEPGAPHEFADDERGEVVGSHARERAAVAPDRGAHSADEIGLCHGFTPDCTVCGTLLPA